MSYDNDINNIQGSLEPREGNRLWDELALYPAELDPQLSQEFAAPLTAKVNWYRRSAFAAAAMLVIAVGISLLLPLQPVNIQTYQTARGERTVVNLADGSVMNINSGSLVRMKIDDRQRNIHVERGEALFDVFYDKTRSFVVHTPRGRVEALGTVFNVNLYREELVVTIARGKVLVSNDIAIPSAQAAEVAIAGQQVTVANDGGINSEQLATLQPALAWTEGKIIFRGETLTQAIEQVNRHSAHRVSIIDARINSLPVYGVFNLGDSLGFLSALEKSYNIHAVSESPDLTYLAYRDRGE